MRIPKELIVKDPCQVSVDVLRSRCRQFFAREKAIGARSIWFADHFRDPPKVPPGGVLDVVLFGSFVRRFLESGNWTADHYRLWCLTPAVRDVMVKVMGVPASAVGVIPRARLESKPKATKLPSLSKPFTLVFGGRLSASKNLELLIRTVHALQTEWDLDVELVLSGDFDDRMHPDRGTWRDEDYAGQTKSLIASLEWRRPPRLRHGLGPKNWIRQFYVRPVYVNLSTYVYEDFDVSLSQAREAGWPAIVSDWGGHRDVPSGPGVLKIPPAMIGHAHEGEGPIRLRAQSLAAWIVTEWTKKRVTEPVDVSFDVPESISMAQIDAVRRRFLASLGEGSLTLQRRGFDGFGYEPASEKFFAAYRGCFAAPFRDREAVAVLINDLHRSREAGLADIEGICREILRKSSKKGRAVVFVPVREILHPMNHAVIDKVREVVVPFDSAHSRPLFRHWRRLGVEAPISVVTRSRNGLALNAILLRDRI